jgi:hypothetical protein
MTSQEKRKFVRVPCENILTYTKIKEDGSVDMGHSGYVHCKNVSQGGILFSAFENFQKGEKLQIKMRLNFQTANFEIVSMIGEVSRSQEVTLKKKWDIGLSITHVEEKKKEVFVNWLANKISP